MWDIGERTIRKVTIESLVAVFLTLSCSGGGTETKERVVNGQALKGVEMPKNEADSSLTDEATSENEEEMNHMETGKIKPYDEKTFAHLTSKKSEVQVTNDIKRSIFTYMVTPTTEPIAILKYLATRSDIVVGFNFEMLGLHEENCHFPRGWVRRSDVEDIIEYVSSVQPASPVINRYSSNIPDEFGSTVGIEAMAILDEYRGVMYPPLNTGYYYCKPDKQQSKAAEFIEWWEGLEKD